MLPFPTGSWEPRARPRIPCADCGAEIVQNRHNHRRCTACSLKRQQEQRRRSSARAWLKKKAAVAAKGASCAV